MSQANKVWWWNAKGYWCSQIDGKRKLLAKGKKNKKLAQQKLTAILAERQLLKDVNGEVTVARLCEEFLEDAEHNLAHNTYLSYQHACQKLVDLFGNRLAHSIEPLDVERFARDIKTSLNPTSQAIVLRSIQRCFNWGVEKRLIPPHKLGRIRKPQPLRRDRYLTDAEFQAMLRATNPRNGHQTGACFRRLLVAMDLTLCRPGELARLKWEHVDDAHDLAILPDHKTKRTGKPKIIPLVPTMKALLYWIKVRSNSEYCFVNSRGLAWNVNSIDQRMSHIKERANLHGVVPYTLRHRAATNAVLRTGDLKMTSLLLGHTSTATTERYTHLAQEHLVNFAKGAVGPQKRA